MNETDVREILVRPLLHRLGYQHGTESNIRTEQTFRYGKLFLGHKKPTDPDLIGRADYILEIASVGRWVAEAKAPSEKLTEEVVQQAHSYAAHPEVNALFFLITNGRSYKLYRTSKLDAPLMAWEWDDIDDVVLALGNLVGPDAIRKKMKLLQPDLGKPLAAGIASQVEIIGGWVRYEDHSSNHPLIDIRAINGLELPVIGGRVSRAEDGRLHALVKTAQAAPLLGELSAVLDSGDGYDFFSSDPYVSVNRETPTIFQNAVESQVPAGTKMSVPGFGDFPVPFSFRSIATTEAIGFIQGDVFEGTMQLSYEFFLENMPLMIRAAFEQKLGKLPSTLRAEGGGRFEVKLLNL
jgi:hypothetical protein